MNEIHVEDCLGERIIAAARLAVAAHLSMDGEKMSVTNDQNQPQQTADQQAADNAQRTN